MADFVFDIDINARYNDEEIKQLSAELKSLKEEADGVVSSTKDGMDSISRYKHDTAITLSEAAESAILELSDLINPEKKTSRGNYVFRNQEIDKSSSGIEGSYIDAIAARVKVINNLTKQDEYNGKMLQKTLSSLPQNLQKNFEETNTKLAGPVIQAYQKYAKQLETRNIDSVVNEMIHDATLQTKMSNAGVRIRDMEIARNYLKASVMRNNSITNTQDFWNKGSFASEINIPQKMLDNFTTERDKSIIRKQGRITSDSNYSIAGSDYEDVLSYYLKNPKFKSTDRTDTHIEHRRFNDEGFAKFASIIKNNPKILDVAIKSGIVQYDTTGGKGSGIPTISRDITIDKVFGSKYNKETNTYEGFLPELLKQLEYMGANTMTAGYSGDEHRGKKRGNIWANSTEELIAENGKRYFNNPYLNAYNKFSKLAEEIFSDDGLKNLLTARSFGNETFAFDNSTEAKTIDMISKEMYNIQKISPFLNRKKLKSNNDKALIDRINTMLLDPFRENPDLDENIISLNESEFTRLAERANGGFTNKQRNDIFKIIGLAGYNKNNPDDVTNLTQLINEYSRSDSQYAFAGFHGTGENLIMRLVRRDVAEKTNEYAVRTAIENYRKLNPNYTEKELRDLGMLSTFENAVTGGFNFSNTGTRLDLNKQLDAANKIYTPNVEISRPSAEKLKGKRFLIINEGEIKKQLGDYGSQLTGDETALNSWNGQIALSTDVFGGIENNAAQMRFGSSGKASAVFMKDPVAFLKNLGIKELTNVMGAEGEKVDITKGNIAGVLSASAIKNLEPVRKIIEAKGNGEEALKLISDFISNEFSVFGVGMMKDYSKIDDADNIGSQLGRQIYSNPLETSRQIQLLNDKARRMRAGDAREILNTIYNGGSGSISNPNALQLSNTDAVVSRNAALSKSVQEDVENFITAKTNDLLRGSRTVFDTNLRGGYKQLAVLSNNTFREFIDNNFGSDENINALKSLTKKERKENRQAQIIDTFTKWARNESGMNEKDLSALGITNTNNETSDYIISKLLSLEGRYKKNADGKFIKTSDIYFSNDTDGAAAPYRNPGQLGETKALTNVSGILSKFFDYIGDYNGTGFMANQSILKQLAGADNDGDIVKMIGVRGLSISRLANDLGLDNSETTKLDLQESMIKLNDAGDNLAFVEQYSEKLKEAIINNNKKIASGNVSSVEEKKLLAQNDAYSELLERRSTLLSVVSSDNEVSKIVEQLKGNEIDYLNAKRQNFKLGQTSLDKNDKANIIDGTNRTSTMVEYVGRASTAPQSMGATSNIGAKFASYIAGNRELELGQSAKMIRYVAESLFGNQSYDIATTEVKKEKYQKYLHDVIEASKSGNPFSRFVDTFTDAELVFTGKKFYDKKSGRTNMIYNKAGVDEYAGTPRYIYDDEEANKYVVKIQGTNKAYDLRRFISGVESDSKDALGYDIRQLIWNQMPFTAADTDARISSMNAYLANPSEREGLADSLYAATKTLADTDKIFTDNNEYGKLSKDSATYRLMLDWGKVLSEEAVGKRIGISDTEANSLLVGAAQAMAEINDAAKEFTKYGGMYRNKDTNNLITTKKYKELTEEEKGSYSPWNERQFVNEYMKSTPIGAIIASLGAAVNSNGEAIGSAGALTSEFANIMEKYREKNPDASDFVDDVISKINKIESGTNDVGSSFEYNKLKKNPMFNSEYRRLVQTAMNSGINVVGQDKLFNTKTDIGQLASIDRFLSSLSASFDEISKITNDEDKGSNIRNIFNKHNIDNDTASKLIKAGIINEDSFRKIAEESPSTFDRILSSVRQNGFITNDDIFSEGSNSLVRILETFELLTTSSDAAAKSLERVRKAEDILATTTDETEKKKQQRIIKEEKTTQDELNNIQYGKNISDMRKSDLENVARDALDNEANKKMLFDSIQGSAKRMNSVLSPFAGIDLGNGLSVEMSPIDNSYSAFSSAAYRNYESAKKYYDANPFDTRAAVMYQQAQGVLGEIDKAYLINMKQTIGSLFGEEFAPSTAQSFLKNYTVGLDTLANAYDSIERFPKDALTNFSNQIENIDLYNSNKSVDELEVLDVEKTIKSILSSVDSGEYLKTKYNMWYNNQIENGKETKIGDRFFVSPDKATQEDYDAFATLTRAVPDITKLRNVSNITKSLKESLPGTKEEAKEKLDISKSRELEGILTTFNNTIIKMGSNIRSLDANGLSNFTKTINELKKLVKELGDNQITSNLIKSNSELNKAFSESEKIINNESYSTTRIASESGYNLRRISAGLKGESFSDIRVPFKNSIEEVFTKQSEEVSKYVEMYNASINKMFEEENLLTFSKGKLIPATKEDVVAGNKEFSDRYLNEQKYFGRISAAENIIKEQFGISLNKNEEEDYGGNIDSIIKVLEENKRREPLRSKKEIISRLREKYEQAAEASGLDVLLSDDDLWNGYLEDVKSGRIKDYTSEAEKRYTNDINKLKELKPYLVDNKNKNNEYKSSSDLYKLLSGYSDGKQFEEATIATYVNKKLAERSSNILELKQRYLNETDETKKSDLEKIINEYISEDDLKQKATDEIKRQIESEKLSSGYNASKTVSKFTGDKTFSTDALTELYLNKVKQEIESAKKTLENKIKSGDKNAQKQLDVLNLITDNDIANKIKGDLDYQLKQEEEIKASKLNQYEFRNRTSDKRAINNLLMRFGISTLSQRGDYTIENAIGYLQNERSTNMNAIKDMRDTYTDINFDTGKTITGKDLSAEQAKINAQYIATNKTIEKQEALIKKLQSAYGTSFSKIIALASKAGSALQRFALSIGRKALQEAINFTKQFDESMHTIQAITLKSDTQMEKVRNSAITQAKELNTSVKTITTAQESLYRQGLSDADVEKRTASIVKYAKVTGTDITKSIKSITAAMNTGLTSSFEHAIDVLVALGDAAATTSEEIAKGMQKAAAAAKTANVSYEELSVLLAMGTAKTQLGGSQIGRSLNTMLTRYRKVSNEGISSSEGGTVAINDVESALANAGVSIRDSADSFRSFTDIMLDLSKVWETLTDVEKANITYTMAGTTQGNVFQSLMSALSEDNGEEYERLLNEAENSDGITDEKYEIKAASINTSIEALKTSFDGLVENFSFVGEAIASIIDGISGIIDWFSSNVVSSIAGVGAALLAFVNPWTAAIAAIVGATAALVTVLNEETKIRENNLKVEKETSENIKGNNKETKSLSSAIKNIIENNRIDYSENVSLKNSITENAFEQIEQAFDSLTSKYPELGNNIDLATVSLSDFIKALEGASDSSNKYAEVQYALAVKNKQVSKEGLLETTPLDISKAKDIITTGKMNYTIASSFFSEGANSTFFKDISDRINSGQELTETQSTLLNLFYSALGKEGLGYWKQPIEELKYFIEQGGDLSNYEEVDAANIGNSFYKYAKQFLGYNLDPTIVSSANKDKNLKNIDTILSTYSTEFEGLNISLDDISSQIVNNLGEQIYTITNDDLIKYVQDYLYNNISKEIITNGKSAKEISNSITLNKYKDEYGNYYSSKEDYLNAIENNSEYDKSQGGRKLYDSTTGKYATNSAQSYFSTNVDAFNYTEKYNKIEFANFVRSFKDKDIESLLSAMNESEELISKYGNYLNSDSITTAIANIYNGTGTFEDFIEAVVEYASTISDSVIYSTEFLNNAREQIANSIYENDILEGTISNSGLSKWASSKGLDENISLEEAQRYIKANQDTTLDDNAMSQASAFINELGQYAFSILSAAGDASSVSDVVSILGGKSIPEIIETLNAYGADTERYSNAYSALTNKGIYFDGSLGLISNPYFTVNEKGEVESSEYAKIELDKATGDVYAIQEKTEGNGHVYTGTLNGEKVRFVGTKTDNGNYTSFTNEGTSYNAQQDENGYYVLDSNGNEIRLENLSEKKKIGNINNPGFSMSATWHNPYTYKDVLMNRAANTGAFDEQTKTAYRLDVLEKLFAGQSIDDIISNWTTEQKDWAIKDSAILNAIDNINNGNIAALIQPINATKKEIVGYQYSNGEITNDDYKALSWYYGLSANSETRTKEIEEYGRNIQNGYVSKLSDIQKLNEEIAILSSDKQDEIEALIGGTDITVEQAIAERQSKLNEYKATEEEYAATWNILTDAEKRTMLNGMGYTTTGNETSEQLNTIYATATNSDIALYTNSWDKAMYKTNIQANNSYYQEKFRDALYSSEDYDSLMTIIDTTPGLKQWVLANSQAASTVSNLKYNLTDTAKAAKDFAESIGEGAAALESFRVSSVSMNTSLENTNALIFSTEWSDAQKEQVASQLGYSNWTDYLNRGGSEEKARSILSNQKTVQESSIIDSLNAAIGSDFMFNGQTVKATDIKKQEIADTLEIAAGQTADYFITEFGFDAETATKLATENANKSISINVINGLNDANEVVGKRYSVTGVGETSYKNKEYYTDVNSAIALRNSNDPFKNQKQQAIYDNWYNNNMSYTAGGLLVGKLGRGTITETEKEQLASYLGIDVRKLRGENAYKTASQYYGYKTEERNQGSKELLSDLKETVSASENVSEATKAIVSGFEDASSAAEYVLSHVEDFDDATIQAAEDIKKYDDGLNDVVSNAEKLKTAMASVNEAIDFEKSKNELTAYLASAGSTMDELNEKLKADDAWNSVITNSTEALRIMNLYEEGTLSEVEAMKQLAAVTAGISLSRETDIDIIKENIRSGFNGLETYSSKDNFKNDVAYYLYKRFYGYTDDDGNFVQGLSITDPDLFAKIFPIYSNLMDTTADDYTWYGNYNALKATESIDRYTKELGINASSKFTGYSSSVGSMYSSLLSNNNDWISIANSFATDRGNFNAYKYIIDKARTAGGTDNFSSSELSLLKEAENYLGYKWDNSKITGVISDIETGFIGFENVLRTALGDYAELVFDTYDDAVKETLDNAKSGTSKTIQDDVYRTKARGANISDFYAAWILDNNTNLADYNLGEDEEMVKLIESYNAATNPADKQRIAGEIYSATSDAQYRAYGYEATTTEADEMAAYISKGDYEGALAYAKNHPGVYDKVVSLYGQDFANLYKYGSSQENFDYIVKEAQRNRYVNYNSEQYKKNISGSNIFDLSSFVSGYSDAYYNGNLIKQNSSIADVASQMSEYEYYKGIIEDKKAGKIVKYSDLQAAENYFGAKYNSKEIDVILEQYANSLTEALSIITQLFGEEVAKLVEDTITNKTTERANSTRQEIAYNAKYTKDEQDALDVGITAYLAGNKTALDELRKSNTDLDTLFADYENGNIGSGEFNNKLLQFTSRGKKYGVSGITKEQAQAAFDLLKKDDYESIYNLDNGEQYGLISALGEYYGSDIYDLFKVGADRSKAPQTIAKAEREFKKNELATQKENGTISSPGYEFAIKALDYGTLNEYDKNVFNEEMNSYEDKAKSYGSEIADLEDKNKKINGAGEITYRANIAREALGMSNLTDEEAISIWNSDRGFENLKSKAYYETGLSDFYAGWKTLTEEDRIKLNLPKNEEEFQSKYGYDPEKYYVPSVNAANPYESTSANLNYSFYSQMGKAVESGMSGTDFIDSLSEEMKAYLESGYADEVGKIFEKLKSGKGTVLDLSKAYSELTKTLNKTSKATLSDVKAVEEAIASYQQAKYLLEKFNAGTFNKKKGSDDMSLLSSILGIDEGKLLDIDDSSLKNMLTLSMSSAQEDVQTIIQPLIDEFLNNLQIPEEFIIRGENGEPIKYKINDLEFLPGEITMLGIEEIYALADATGNEILKTIADILMAKQVSVTASVTASGNTVTGSFDKVSMSGVKSSSRGASSSGGGGSKKSRVQVAITNSDRQIGLQQHRIDMLDAEAETYKEKGLLTDYGKVLTYKNREQEKLQEKYKAGIASVKSAMSGYKNTSDEYWSGVEKIQDYEEAIAKLNKEIEANNKLIAENNEEIRQTKITVQDTLREAIEGEQELKEAMLDAQVNLEEEILEAIKARYQSEWDLMSENLEKQKEALEKEKELLDERVSARRDAEDRISKEEEKAELERQLALVEMDSTRTKDAADLREQISELNKELNREAEDELIASQQKMLDDEIAAIDDMLESGANELETFLADANNFSTELNSILELGQEDLMAWLKENVVAFTQSTEAAQKQMLIGWTDTFEEWKNIVDKYREQIKTLMTDRDTFMSFLTQTSEYITADETTQESMRYEWEKIYDDYKNAYTDDNTKWSHTDFWASAYDNTEKISEASEAIRTNTYAVKELTDRIKAICDELGIGNATHYASGGLVDYTGYAWVDGSPSKPEYVLSANQWADFSEMIDSSKFSYIPDRINYGGTGFDASSISMVNNITINQASISDSMDIAELAQQVGEEFSKSLSLNGFNTRFNI